MALSRQSRRTPSPVVVVSGALLAALALMSVAATHAATKPSPLAGCKQIDIDGNDLGTKLSKSKDGDRGTDLDKVKINGCDMEIVAKHVHATSLDFDDSTWTFTGDVHIRLGQQQSKLSSDEAVVRFRNNEIEQLTITGKPAEFEQKRPDSDVVTRGHSGRIVYEAEAGTVTLQDDVWLTDSGKQITGQRIVYDIRKSEVSNARAGDSERGGERIHIVIDPQAAKDQKKKNDDKKPASTPP